MRVDPMSRDVGAPADPHVVMPFDVIEPLPRRKTHVVAIERIRDDKMRRSGAVAFFDLGSERRVVTVVIGVVEKRAEHQPSSTGTVTAGVPAHGRIPSQASDDVHCTP